jgi:hypothetical protein
MNSTTSMSDSLMFLGFIPSPTQFVVRPTIKQQSLIRLLLFQSFYDALLSMLTIETFAFADGIEFEYIFKVGCVIGDLPEMFKCCTMKAGSFHLQSKACRYCDCPGSLLCSPYRYSETNFDHIILLYRQSQQVLTFSVANSTELLQLIDQFNLLSIKPIKVH